MEGISELVSEVRGHVTLGLDLGLLTGLLRVHLLELVDVVLVVGHVLGHADDSHDGSIGITSSGGVHEKVSGTLRLGFELRGAASEVSVLVAEIEKRGVE